MQFKFKVLLSSPFKRHLTLYRVCTITVQAPNLTEARKLLDTHGTVVRTYNWVRSPA